MATVLDKRRYRTLLSLHKVLWDSAGEMSQTTILLHYSNVCLYLQHNISIHLIHNIHIIYNIYIVSSKNLESIA